jgi:predicted DNA-binding transcriptional regulator AlpA
LGIERKTLDALRLEKGFPYIRLTVKSRVYFTEDVLEWLKQHRKTAC